MKYGSIYGKKYCVKTDYRDWDNEFTIEILEEFISEYYKKLKKGGTLILFFDLWKISHLKDIMEKYKFKQIRFIEWIKTNPTKLIEHDTWLDTLKVCKYFLSTPKPDLYIRQLPIDIHTKYIWDNKVIVQSLLEFLIPEHINKDETKFELRFNLKFSEHLIRVRFLDKALSPLDNATDISLTVSEFNNFHSHCDNIFVAENLMNFLTLPYLTKTIAIWSGGGFNVSHLQNIDWLKNKQFYYWGDIDAHGFQILNQFRTYFPNTIAVMMDEETLSSFTSAGGQQAANQNLQRLTESELKLYNHLRQNNIRLEQEKITQTFAEDRIKKLFNKQVSYF